jgi:hypothetical protein
MNEIEKKNKQFYQVEKPNQLLKYIKNKPYNYITFQNDNKS